ncbi:MAG: bifunctional riboflavin kinase/FAD synthetase [Dehalococcoidia bacterium]|nr:bifunctional riboflavin kinase/FAD synthetase [Dehalococcoidia bacterium]
MEIEQELANIAPQSETLLTIGVFDGVHAGHRYLLEKLKRKAAERNLVSGVVTFNPHPQSVLNPHNQILWLSAPEDRVKSLQRLGINLVAVLTFTQEVAKLSAREFMILVKKHLRMRGIMVGPDFTLGRGQEGNIHLLRTLGREMNFSLEVIPPCTINGEIVSSTLIRQALTQGDMGKVRRLMGHYFQIGGKVVPSDKRGRILGFPTANLDIKPQQALPSNGIYATVTQVDDKQFHSATNIGTRPTFGKGKKTVETHLLNYKGDLYSKEIRVEFVQKLRDEQRFPSSEELKTQIEQDIQEIDAILRAAS